MKHFRTRSRIVVLLKLAVVVGKYAYIHRKMFGSYEFELMPRPSKEVLKELDCSYMAFLKRKGLDSLRPFLQLTLTVQGYGYLDEISALYGLMYHTS